MVPRVYIIYPNILSIYNLSIKSYLINIGIKYNSKSDYIDNDEDVDIDGDGDGKIGCCEDCKTGCCEGCCEG